MIRPFGPMAGKVHHSYYSEKSQEVSAIAFQYLLERPSSFVLTLPPHRKLSHFSEAGPPLSATLTLQTPPPPPHRSIPRSMRSPTPVHSRHRFPVYLRQMSLPRLYDSHGACSILPPPPPPFPSFVSNRFFNGSSPTSDPGIPRCFTPCRPSDS
eukprot:752599-Hanusia_phi.AAC.1